MTENLMDINRSKVSRIGEVENYDTYKCCQRRRYFVVTLIYIGFFIFSMLRVNMSVTIVAMTSNISEKKSEFDWDSKLQGFILSSSFYGYIGTTLLGEWLSSRVGANRVFGIGICVASLLTLITPPLARLSVYCLIALRILGGVFQSLAIACVQEIWSNWALPLETSKHVSSATAGFPIGIEFAMASCGIICWWSDWSYIFYAYGVIGLIFFIVWNYNVKDDPADDPKLTFAELQYIKQLHDLNNHVQEEIPIPWKSIFSSPAVWAIIIAQFSTSWGAWTMYTQLPKFLCGALNFPLDIAGIIAAIPYLLLLISFAASDYLARHRKVRETLTMIQLRKIYICLGFSVQIILTIVAVLSDNSLVIIACTTLTIGLSGFITVGFCTNHFTIAPQHANVLREISNTIGMLPAILSPIITGYIVQNGTDSEWKIVVIITGVIFIIGAITYGLLGSDTTQKWAKIGGAKIEDD